MVERCFNRPSHGCKQRLPGSDQGLAITIAANVDARKPSLRPLTSPQSSFGIYESTP